MVVNTRQKGHLMAIVIGDVWQPSPGVNQLNINLGRGVNVEIDEAVRRFTAVPGVEGAGAVGGMWPRGHIDLKLASSEWTARLRSDLIGVCQALLRDG